MYNICLSSLYGVIVVSGEELNNAPDDIIDANNGNLPPPYPGQDGIYTAAVYTREEDVPTLFVVGNNIITTANDGRQYVNRRLSENTQYGVFYYIRLQSDSGNVVSRDIIIMLTVVILIQNTSVITDIDYGVYTHGHYASCSAPKFYCTQY